MIRYVACLGVLLFVLGLVSESPADSLLLADRVVVRKSERKLFLEKGGQIMREYPVSLGMNPLGHKEQRGDKRTPEGSYTISYRLSASKFRKALHISYPSREDIRAARAKGYDPGGLIMIHGLPAGVEEEEDDYIQRDWTDGCIAVTNDAIDLIWNLVRNGTPVDILP
jgi:murein L,D-transpeptidase YafK